jgi:hypothetical protein
MSTRKVKFNVGSNQRALKVPTGPEFQYSQERVYKESAQFRIQLESLRPIIQPQKRVMGKIDKSRLHI